MKCLQVTILAAICVVLNGPSADAQSIPDVFTRVAGAEVANYSEGLGWVDNVTDTDNCDALGECTVGAQVTLGSATVAAGQFSTARSTPDSALVAGSMWVQATQTSADMRHYLFPYTGVVGEIYLVVGGTYSIRGHRSEICSAHLWITNQAGERTTVDLQVGAADFQYTGYLAAPGYYQFHLGLDHLTSSSAEIAIHDALDFELSIYRPALVPSEPTSWGTIKAQYR